MALRGRGLSFHTLMGKCQRSRTCEMGEIVLWKMQPAGLTILILLDIHEGMGQLREWMADGGSQVSHCWMGIHREAGQEVRMIYVVMD